MMRQAISLAFLLLLPVASAAQPPHDDGHDPDATLRGAIRDAHDEAPEEPDAHDRAVRLSDEELAEFGIVLDVAGSGVVESHVAVPGEVRPDADRLAHIVPRFPGIVTEVRAEIGDRVETGDVLAVVESDESLSPFEVRTLISGTVIGKHITLGEAVGRDQDAYVIADLGSVWIDLTVYQRDLGRIRAGRPVRLLVGHEPVGGETVVDYVTPVLDEATRTATARVILDNPDGVWRPGMFVTGRVRVDRAEAAVVVPRTALHTMDGEPVVFVREEGAFRPRTVRVGREGEASVEIAGGLAAGETYVREGGFTLKAEFGKSSFDRGHAH